MCMIFHFTGSGQAKVAGERLFIASWTSPKLALTIHGTHITTVNISYDQMNVSQGRHNLYAKVVDKDPPP
jgi:hypothetical protein